VTKRRQQVWRVWVPTALLLWLLGGWGPRLLLAAPAAPEPTAAALPLTQHKDLGAVRLTVTAERQQLSLTDPLKLTLTLTAPPDLRVTLPEVPKALGPFTVLQHHTTGPLALAPQAQQWQREYSLTATAGGSLVIPPLTVQIQEGESRQELTTEPLSITVTALVPADADPSAPKDIAGPVALAQRGLPSWAWWSSGALALLGLLAAAWWWYRHRQRAVTVVLQQRPAHALALAALAHLQRQDLIGQERIEAFYLRLSSIVRRYVELRFGLRAPEQTTEEFLNAVLTTGGLIAAHQELLESFLQHCDLVKFARHQPRPADMEEAFDRAKNFVESTADMEVLVTVPASGEALL